MNLRLLCLFVMIFLGNSLMVFAQQDRTRISGVIKSMNQENISNANVQLKLSDNGQTLSFVRTNAEGQFTLLIPQSIRVEQCFLFISHIAYEPTQFPLETNTYIYTIQIEDKLEAIAEVKVGVRPRITSRGDTIAYAMNTFARPEDRSVADVLRRMPGFTVGQDGKISFNGQDVSTLYIGGDDIMGQRYGLATRTVPHDLVLDVEVLRNHQPIQVLKDRVFSNSVAVNLVIKEEAKLKTSGEVTLGGGLPSMYKGTANVMQFNDRLKYLHGLLSNNVGERVDTEVFNTQLPDLIGGNNLSLGALAKPNLPESRYFDHLSGLVSTNQHLNLKNDWKWQTSIDGFKERSDQQSAKEQYLISDLDEPVFSEINQRSLNPGMGQFGMKWYQNISDRFLNLETKAFYADLAGWGDFGAQSFQGLNIKDLRFSQDIKYIPKLKSKDVISLEGALVFGRKPSSLSIRGHKEDLLPLYLQDLSMQSTRGTLSFKYHVQPKKIIQHYEAILNFSREKTDSNLDSLNIPSISENAITWSNKLLRLGANYTYNVRKFNFLMSLPVALRSTSYSNAIFATQENRQDLLFTPVLRIKYVPSAQHDWTVEYRNVPTISSGIGINEGVIMWNNRDFRKMNLGIQRQRMESVSLNYRFNHIPSSSFGYFSYNYMVNRQHVLPKLTLLENAVLENAVVYESILLDNKSDQHQFMFNFSKYLSLLKANSSIYYQWSFGIREYLLGEQLLNNAFTMQQIRVNLNARLQNQISMSYNGSLSYIKNQAQNKLPANTRADKNRVGVLNQNHHLQLSYSIQRKHFIHFNTHLLNNRGGAMASKNFYFVDVSFLTKLNAYRIDLELSFRNLTNVQRFASIYFSELWMYQTEMALRGRQGMLAISYRF